MKNYEQFWDSPKSVAQYAAPPVLFRGERLALQECLPGVWKGGEILDLACGAGRTTYFLHQKGAHVIGVDIAKNLIDAARTSFPDIDFRVGDMTALEFAADSFDVVLVSFNSLDCLYPKEVRMTALREVWRVLRPNGTLVFSHHNLAAFFFGWYRFLRPAKLVYRLRHILNGGAFRAECYLPELEIPQMKTYYAWPGRVVADLRDAGFELLHIFPNDPLAWYVQRILRSDRVTRLVDPWPYYVCRKAGQPPLGGSQEPRKRRTPD